MSALMVIFLTAAAVPVLVRVCKILHDLKADHFGGGWRRQGFGIAYALLAALTAQTVLDAWAGAFDPARAGFVMASCLLILTDRRRNPC